MDLYRWLVSCLILTFFFCLVGFCFGKARKPHQNAMFRKTYPRFREVSIDCKVDEANDAIIEKFILLSDKLKKGINEQLILQEDKINQLETTTRANEKSISNYFTIVSLFVGAVIGLVALVLGLGAYRFYMDNKQIVERMNKLLEKRFGPWLAQREKECHQELEKLSTYYQGCMENLMYYLVLRNLIKEPQPTPEDIFPFLTPLVANPRILYKPLFEKIKQLEIHPEVTKKAQEGLDKLADQ